MGCLTFSGRVAGAGARCEALVGMAGSHLTRDRAAGHGVHDNQARLDMASLARRSRHAQHDLRDLISGARPHIVSSRADFANETVLVAWELIDVERQNVVDFAASILGIVRGIKADEKDRLRRIAELLGQIADCMQRIIDASRNGEWSRLTGNCEELGGYFKRFGELDLGPFLSNKTTSFSANWKKRLVLARE